MVSQTIFQEQIPWNSDDELKYILKEHLHVKPHKGIESKRTQVIDGMRGIDLTTQLDYFGVDLGNERNV